MINCNPPWCHWRTTHRWAARSCDATEMPPHAQLIFAHTCISTSLAFEMLVLHSMCYLRCVCFESYHSKEWLWLSFEIMYVCHTYSNIHNAKLSQKPFMNISLKKWAAYNVTTLTPLTYVTLEHKTSVKSLGNICSNSQKYIVWVKIIDFSFMPKIIWILSKDHVPWRFFVNLFP